MKKLTVFFLALVFSPALSFAATPTITSVTGTVATGQTLTIAGSNMVQENKTGWDTAFQNQINMYGFESSVSSGTPLQESPDNDNWYLRNNYQDGQPSGAIMNNCKFINSPKLSGVLSMECRVYGGKSLRENDGGSGFSAYPGSTSGNFYFRFYTRYHSNNGFYPDNYTKMIVTQPAGSGAMWYLDLGGAVIGQNPTELTTKYGSVSGPSPAFALQDDRWYCIEGIWLSPGTYQLYVDNVLKVNTSPGVAMPDNAYPQFGIINYGSNGTYVDMSQWTDNLAFGHSGRIYPSAVIEVSGDGTTWKYQEPVALGETSSQIKLDLSGLTGTAYRVRITNNRQEVSSSYLLSGGSPTPVDGSCGAASGQSFISLDATNPTLCDDGEAFAFTVGSSYTWGCSGVDGGSSTSSTACTASISSTPAMFGEDFDNGDFATRGWYDNTTHGTIVSGGQTGNCLQWAWTAGQTQPTNGGALRRLFTPTDSLYVSFYVKFGTGWQGSQQTYHPHIITIPSDMDDIYAPLASNYLNTYIEFLSDVGAPYAIRPSLALQDSLRVNSSLGTPPLDLSAVTENRSVTHCNTPAPTGGVGICYADSPWYSANLWPDSTPSISENSWHLVETYFKMNDVVGGIGQANGVMQQWVDGTQIVNRGNILYRTGQDPTKKWAQFVLAPWIGDGSPIDQTMWIDELVVATDAPAAPGVSGSSFSGVLNGVIQ